MASESNPYFKTYSDIEFVSRKSKKKKKSRTKQFSSPEELERDSNAMQSVESKEDCNPNNDNDNDSEAASDDSTKEVASPVPSALLLSPPVSLDAFASVPPQLDREKIFETEYYPDPNDVKYQEQESKLSPQPVSGDENEEPPLLNTKALSKHAKTYELEKFEKNVLIIFNQKKIDGHSTRLGTEKDVESLTRTFSRFSFEVVEHLDFTKKQIEDELKAFSRRNFTDYGCVAVAVLTHGSDNGLLRAKDQQYSEVEIIKHFKVVNKPTLVTKPKIIIIQACRGSVIVPGAAVMRAGKVRKDLDEPVEPYILPVESDMLILHSSYSGSPSHRNDIHGSWFIQELCSKIDSQAATEDLESIVTEVKREVAINKQHEEYNRRTLEIDINKQMPVITSTLIRKLYFRKFGEKPLKLQTFMDGKRDSGTSETGQDSFDNAVSNTPFLVQLGPCSCFLDYFNYLRNCLRHFCSENPHDDAAQYLLEVADAFEEGDQFNTSKQKMIKAISKHIVNNAQSCPYFKYLYINKQG